MVLFYTSTVDWVQKVIDISSTEGWWWGTIFNILLVIFFIIDKHLTLAHIYIYILIYIYFSSYTRTFIEGSKRQLNVMHPAYNQNSKAFSPPEVTAQVCFKVNMFVMVITTVNQNFLFLGTGCVPSCHCFWVYLADSHFSFYEYFPQAEHCSGLQGVSDLPKLWRRHWIGIYVSHIGAALRRIQWED